MKRPPLRQQIAAWCRRLLARAQATQHPALYVVPLCEPRGLALAIDVHHRAGGPDPAAVLARSQAAGSVSPLMALAAPAAALADAIEALGGLAPQDRAVLAWTVRELPQSGEVPIFLLLDGTAVVTTLAGLEGDDVRQGLDGWTVPAVGEA